jgi:hypothetical protein
LKIHADKRVFPFDGGQRPQQTFCDVPEDHTTQVDTMFYKLHAAILRPAIPVVVPDNIVVCGVWIGTRLICCEAEEDMKPVDVMRV